MSKIDQSTVRRVTEDLEKGLMRLLKTIRRDGIEGLHPTEFLVLGALLAVIDEDSDSEDGSLETLATVIQLLHEMLTKAIRWQVEGADWASEPDEEEVGVSS